MHATRFTPINSHRVPKLDLLVGKVKHFFASATSSFLLPAGSNAKPQAPNPRLLNVQKTPSERDDITNYNYKPLNPKP